MSFVGGTRLRGAATIPAPKPVILDTDLAFDVDDVAAIAVACALDNLGEISLKAVITNSANDYSAPCAQALLNYCGKGSVPVGAYQGSAGTPSTSLYAQTVAAEFGQSGKTRANFPSADSVYRSVLAATSLATIVSVGFLTNLAALINTADGAALLSSQVAKMVIMGGDYPVYAAGEFNLAGNAQAASDWFSKSKIPTYLLGLTPGGLLACGPSAGASGGTNPIKRAFDLFGVNPRSAWDPAAVLFAARGVATGIVEGWFGGNNSVDPVTGANTFGGNFGRNCGILNVPGNAADRNAINAVLNGLVQTF